MPFADFMDLSTIAPLLIEATVFGLALATAFLGVFAQPVRWLARGLPAITLVLGLGFVVGMGLELWTSNLPFVVPDAPLGTYAQMTQLGLLLDVLTWGLIALGSVLAFRRPGLGGLFLVITGCLAVLDQIRDGLQDLSLPRANFIFGLELVIFVPVVGALVLATWWADHTESLERPAPGSRPRAVGRLAP